MEGKNVSTRDNLNAALKESMKNKDMERVATIRLITAAMKDKDINSRTEGRNDGIDESAVLSLLQSMIKQRTESAKIYRENNRPELADKEDAEIKVIESFLPQQLSDEDVAKAVGDIVTATGASGMKDMGKVMAELRAKYAGQMDMAKAGDAVKKRLAG
jgi:uncharacterized protein YqeY